MDMYTVQESVRQLSDTELAMLVCLVAEQHCIIRASSDSVLDIHQEILATSLDCFGFSSATIECSGTTTIEDFSERVLQFPNDQDTLNEQHSLDTRRVANVVVAIHLDQAPYLVQIQALELMRSRRIYTREAAHAVPKRFLFIALLSDDQVHPPFLTHYLNDFFFISHTYNGIDAVDSFDKDPTSETSSLSSNVPVVRKPTRQLSSHGLRQHAKINEPLLAFVQEQYREVLLTAEVRRYIRNIITFMRLHRAVQGGISAISSRHLTTLSRVLAPLHGLDYVTPALVSLAVQKIYLHRIIITAPDDERSMQWGSSLDAVRQALDGVTPETVISDVLMAIPAPL